MTTTAQLNTAGYMDFDGTDYHHFIEKLLDEARPYGYIVTSLRQGTEFIRNRPGIDDLYMSADGTTPSETRKYEFTSKTTELSSEGRKALRDDTSVEQSSY
jgi:hypothetical protein